jgi:hypothetical protein
MRRGWFLGVSLVGASCLGIALAAPAPAAGPGAHSHRTRPDGFPAFSTVPFRTTGGTGARSAPGAGGERPAAPVVGPNVNVSNRPDAQSETSVAIDPTDPKHILASVNDLYEGDGLTAKVYESFDRGATWTDTLAIPGGFCYDTWLDFTPDGTAYLAYECVDQRVAIKPAGSPVWINEKLANAGAFPDRDMVVTDDTPTSPYYGSVYIGYDDSLEGNGNVGHLMYSRDGLTYLQSAPINDSSETIGVHASVAPDGTVYATWEDFPDSEIKIDTSTDGGATWGTDRLVSHYRLDTSPFFICIPPQPERCVVPFATSEVAPAGGGHAGRIYVSYPDQSTTGTDWDIFVRYSDDGGVTWSPEHRVNDDSVHAWQFQQAISVAPNGLVAVSFYDTRNDPSGQKTDRYISFSRDGGVTWSRNIRITTAMSDETNSPDPNDYGDYQGLDGSATPSGRPFFFASWTDSRQGTQAEDLFVAGIRT